MKGDIWSFLLGYHIGKGSDPDEQEVDKKSCTHTDCALYRAPYKCRVKDCKQHLRQVHSP